MHHICIIMKQIFRLSSFPYPETNAYICQSSPFHSSFVFAASAHSSRQPQAERCQIWVIIFLIHSRMIRISELLLMLTGEGEKLSKSEVRVKLTVAGSVYQSSQVRIHNRSAEWNSNALPMIEIASSCESFPLKMEVILDQGYVLGSGSSEIISGRNTQDCVDIINSKDHYLYGKLLYKADWLYMAQSKFSQHRYQEPKRTIKLSEMIADDDSGCLCGTKKVKKTGKQRTKKKVLVANELIIYEQNQLEKVGKVRKTHFPVQFYTNLKK